MDITGILLCVLGSVVAFVGEWMILTAAFHRGTILSIGCLLIPIVVYAFALTHPRRLWLPLTMAVAGVLAVLGGLWLRRCERPLEALYA
jgi:hypothetical protein